METKFYYCPICGNLVLTIEGSGVTPHCCGQPMTELIPNKSDGAGEKHVPVVKALDKRTLRVEVGSLPHPMTPEHHIKFICIETPSGFQLRRLDPAAPAVAEFACPAGELPIVCHPDEGCACGPECDCDDDCSCKGGDKPCPCVDELIAAYEYCTIHGLWMADAKAIKQAMQECGKEPGKESGKAAEDCCRKSCSTK